MKKIAVVFGTRPEIIKLSQLIHLFHKNRKTKLFLVHTDQHYSSSMSDIFLKELKLPKTTHSLKVGSSEQASQVGKILTRFEKFLLNKKPDMVIAAGDTNSGLAAAIASKKLGFKFAHVESGYRSFDRNMQEEMNRILMDQISDYCFAPSKEAVKNLKKSEALKKSVFLTGNTVVDATKRSIKLSKNSKILKKFALNKNNFSLVTLHRHENTDNKKRLSSIVSALTKLEDKIVYPVHPRAKKMLKKFGLWKKLSNAENIKLVNPVGYLDFLKLCINSKIILTDSGGIQQEVTVYKKPVLVLRENTEMPEIIGVYGFLSGWKEKNIVRDYKKVLKNYSKILKKIKKLKSPYGDGKASQKIMKIILS